MLNRNVYFLALAAGVFSSTSVVLGNGFIGGGSISGLISYSFTSGVLGGVTVRAGAFSDVTDANGRYFIDNLDIGQYTVVPSSSAWVFSPASQTVTIRTRGGAVSNISFQATPAHNVSGRVRDGANGISGVTVAIDSRTDITDNTGFFLFSNVVWGAHQVTASKTGQRFLPVSREIVVGQSSGVSNVDFDLAHTVNGTLLDGTNRIAGATIIVSNTILVDRSVSRPDGSYTVSNLIAGAYTVLPRHEGHLFLPALTNVSLGPSRSNVSFSVARFDVAGRVTEQGLGVSNVNVLANGLLTTTDASGFYRFTNMAGAIVLEPQQSGQSFNPAAAVIVAAPGSTGVDFARGTTGAVTRVLSCELGALRTALNRGGHIRMECDAVIPVTSTLLVATNASLDATGHQLTLDGESRVRIFAVQTNIDFAMSNLTLAHAAADRGAALYSEGGRITIAGSRFVTNITRGITAQPRADGGAIYMLGGALRVYESLFQKNDAEASPVSAPMISAGGALFLSGTDSAFERCRFDQNDVSAPNSLNQIAQGGAVHLSNGRAFFTDTYFSTNDAVGGFTVGTQAGHAQGGAIYSVGAMLTILRSTFQQNRSIGGASYPPPFGGASGPQGNGEGGAIYAASTSLHITNVTLYNNIVNAGGIYVEPVPSFPGYAHGPGVYLFSGTGVAMHCTIAGNVGVPTFNASIFSRVPFTVANTIVEGPMFGVTSVGGNFLTNRLSAGTLGPIGDHGGFAPTLPLSASSAAVDLGEFAGSPSEDQRGSPRPSGHAPDSGAFELSIAPTITAADPMTGIPGVSVTLSGASLLTTTQVLFNGISAAFAASNTLTTVVLHTIVPAGATTGPITVLGLSGTAVSSFNFLIDTTPPTLAITHPRDETFVPNLDLIAGSVVDNSSTGDTGVAGVTVFIQRAADSRYWTGTAWALIPSALPAVISSDTWRITNSLPSGSLLPDGSYAVFGEALDNAQNSASTIIHVTVNKAGNIVRVERLPNGHLRMRFPGTAGRAYRVQASLDLIAWADIGSVTASTSGVLEFTDIDAVNHNHRFYRTTAP